MHMLARRGTLYDFNFQDADGVWDGMAESDWVMYVSDWRLNQPCIVMGASTSKLSQASEIHFEM